MAPQTGSGGLAQGQRVRVLDDVAGGNPRTPGYLRGRVGTIVLRHGVVHNPLDHHEDYPPLYSVLFDLDDGRTPHDQVLADLHEDWLAAADG